MILNDFLVLIVEFLLSGLDWFRLLQSVLTVR